MQEEHSQNNTVATAFGGEPTVQLSKPIFSETTHGSNESDQKPKPSTFSSGFGNDTMPHNELTQPTSDQPVPVVKVLSVRGVEYLFMSICLWLSAGSFTGLLLALLNGQAGFAALSFPLSLLLVTLPGFALLFLKLKKAELSNPALRLDASKRRLSQITQTLAFITCLANLVTFVYIVLQKIGGNGTTSLGKTIINSLVILGVAGGILAYYWNDEHRRAR
jgi:hypothetical protein